MRKRNDRRGEDRGAETRSFDPVAALTCLRAMLYISALVYGALDELRKRQLGEHVEACRSCKRILISMMADRQIDNASRILSSKEAHWVTTLPIVLSTCEATPMHSTFVNVLGCGEYTRHDDKNESMLASAREVLHISMRCLSASEIAERARSVAQISHVRLGQALSKDIRENGDASLFVKTWKGYSLRQHECLVCDGASGAEGAKRDDEAESTDRVDVPVECCISADTSSQTPKRKQSRERERFVS